MENQINDQISKAEAQIASDKFNEQNYDRYIEFLRLDRRHIGKLLEARKAKLIWFSINAREITEWLEDLSSIEDKKFKREETEEFYALILAEYPVAGYWKNYLEFAIDVAKQQVTQGDINTLFTEALNDVANDFSGSPGIWKIILGYFVAQLDAEHDQQLFQKVLALHLKRLSYPHLTLDESFSEFSSFISKYDAANYESHMKAASKVVSATKKTQRYSEKYELKLLKDPHDLQTWIEYLENVHKYHRSNLRLLETLFNRFKAGSNRSPETVQIWLTYIYILYEREDVQDLLEDTLGNFMRTYPELPVTYAEYFRNYAPQSYENFLLLLERIDSLDLKNKSTYDEWKPLALAILSYRYKLIQDGVEEELEHMLENLQEWVAYAIESNNDVFHSVEKLAVSIYNKLELEEQAEGVLEAMVRKFGDQSDVWLYYIQYYKSKFVGVERIREFYRKAVVADMDWPEKIIEDWFQFEQSEGDNVSYRQAVVLANSVIKARVEVVGVDSNGADEDVFASPKTPKSRQNTQENEPETRSRENFTVKVSDLGSDVTENDLNKFLKDCGNIKSISVFEEDGKMSATVEFSSEQEVFSALTKHGKRLGGATVTVVRHQESTVFVTNYPPSMSQQELQDKFGEAGTVVNARFPSQRSNRARRFCYIEYHDAQSAKRAVSLFNGVSIQDPLSQRDHILKVVVSDPSKARKPTSELQIRANNLPFTLKAHEIEQLFAQCGTIERTVVPQSKRQRADNEHNDGFAFITFETSQGASKALAMDGSEVHGRKIQVSKQHSHSAGAHFSAQLAQFNDLHSIGLLDVDATLTDKQIEAHFVEKVGPVVRTAVFPEHSAALVEFEAAADAGTASMKSAGQLLGAKTVRVGSKADVAVLLRGNVPDPTKSTKRSLMVPTSVQRKRPKRK